MSAWWTVFRKEVTENLRDRRTVINSLVYGPLFGPVLFAILISFVFSQASERASKPLELPVVGAEHAPNLLAFLRQNNVVIEDAPADPEQAIRDQDKELILRIPAEFAKNWREGRAAPLELIYDQSRQFTETSVRRLTRLVEGYGGRQASMRLLARGINPEIVQAIQIVERDQSSAQSRAGMILAFLPYMLIIGAFVAGMYLAIDTTAGERERQSLEALLINPVPRSQILIGKLTATTVFALAALALSLLAFALALRFVPTGSLGFAIDLSPRSALLCLAVIAPLALLAASSETLVAAFSKSFREAQTWLGMMMILPALPAIILLINPVKPAVWMYWTPLVSQHVVIGQIVRGETLVPWQFAASIGGTLLAGLFLAWVCIRIYHRERLAISA